MIPIDTEGRLRVLQIVNTLDVVDGGPARHAYELGESLVSGDTTVHTLAWSGMMASSIIKPTSAASYLLLAEHSPWSRLRRLAGAVRGADVLIVHGHYLLSTIVASLAAQAFRKPYFLVPHGVFTKYQRRASTRRKIVFDKIVGRMIVQRSSGQVTASQSEFDQLEAPFARSFQIGIGTATFANVAELQERHPPSTQVRILVLSRIATKKRLDIALEAAHLVASIEKPVVITIAGSGLPGLVDDLRSLSDELSAKNPYLVVRWLGNIDGNIKDEAIRQAHVLALPSEDENFGIVIVEALAHGVPVVCTDAAAAAKFVLEPDCAGVVVAGCTATEIASGINWCVADPERWREMSFAALSNAEAGATWSAIAQRWKTLLSSV